MKCGCGGQVRLRLGLDSDLNPDQKLTNFSADDPRICDEPLEAGQMPDAQGGRGQHLKSHPSSPGKFMYPTLGCILSSFPPYFRAGSGRIDLRFIFRLNYGAIQLRGKETNREVL